MSSTPRFEASYDSIVKSFSVGVNDLSAARRFYDGVLATIGGRVVFESSGGEESGGGRSAPAVGYGVTHAEFIIHGRPTAGEKEEPFSAGNGTHLAFNASSKEACHAFYDKALELGATDDGPVGPRPLYGPEYYGGFVRDLDGLKIEVSLLSVPAPDSSSSSSDGVEGGGAPQSDASQQSLPPQSILNHLSLGTNNYEATKAFYDELIPIIGGKAVMEFPGFVGYGNKFPEFWSHGPHNKGEATVGRGTSLSFNAPCKEACEAFFAKALELGAKVEVPLGDSSIAHHNHSYYGGSFRDLDGHLIQVTLFSSSSTSSQEEEVEVDKVAEEAAEGGRSGKHAVDEGAPGEGDASEPQDEGKKARLEE